MIFEESPFKNMTLEKLIDMCQEYLTMGTADLQNFLIKHQKEDNLLQAQLKDLSKELAELRDIIIYLEERLAIVRKERDEYALLLFQPSGETHHNANECPYCKENLNK